MLVVYTRHSVFFRIHGSGQSPRVEYRIAPNACEGLAVFKTYVVLSARSSWYDSHDYDSDAMKVVGWSLFGAVKLAIWHQWQKAHSREPMHRRRKEGTGEPLPLSRHGLEASAQGEKRVEFQQVSVFASLQ